MRPIQSVKNLLFAGAFATVRIPCGDVIRSLHVRIDSVCLIPHKAELEHSIKATVITEMPLSFDKEFRIPKVKYREESKEDWRRGRPFR